MKIKTSITISEELIKSIDEVFGGQKNRSEFIEKAVKHYIERQIQEKRDLDELVSIPKSSLRNFVGSLSPEKIQQMNAALLTALGLS